MYKIQPQVIMLCEMYAITLDEDCNNIERPIFTIMDTMADEYDFCINRVYPN
jgi:hypothetical protein